jgi:hypothetical protein
MFVILLSCAHRPETPPPDIVAQCAESWTDAFRVAELGGSAPRPEDCCSDPERQAWADGLLLRVAEVWGLDVATVDRYVRVRHVEPWGVPTRRARLQVELRVGWITAAYVVDGKLDGPPTTGLDAAAGFRWEPAVPPRALLDEPPREAWRIERDLARCAEDLDLPRQSFWCSGTVEGTVAGVGRHPADVCFRFNVTLPPDETGWSSFARGRACAWDDEVHCSVTQGIRDPAPPL